MLKLKHEIIRFLIVGATNTITSYLIYLTLLHFTHYNIAYSISYVFGVIQSYLLNSYYVFKVKPSLKKALSFPLVYIMQYGLGLILLHIIIKMLHISPETAGILVIIISTPINFVLNRLILKHDFPHNLICSAKKKKTHE